MLGNRVYGVWTKPRFIFRELHFPLNDLNASHSFQLNKKVLSTVCVDIICLLYDDVAVVKVLMKRLLDRECEASGCVI